MFSKLRNIFGSRPKEPGAIRLTTDIHSHLLPGIDDGVETYDEALEVVEGFIDLGFERLITTPHIMQDYYRNEPDHIRELAAILQSKIYDRGWDISIDAAAEYYLDEGLMTKLEDGDEILTFGGKYLLFETSFINKPIYLEQFIFNALSQGMVPVMAHPERYAYIHNDPTLLATLMERGMLSQVNTNSLAGYYSKEVKKMARKIIDQGLVNFVGSDCHSAKHLEVFKTALRDPYFEKVTGQSLLNDEI